MAPHSPSKSRPPPLSPAQERRHRQRSSFVTGAVAGGAAVALLALMILAASSSRPANWPPNDPSSSPSLQASPDPWVPLSALQASASASVTAAAVNALRESGALRASKGSLMASSAAKKEKGGEKKKKNKRQKDQEQQQERPVLPSSLNGLAALALDGDGCDVEATAIGDISPLPRATVVVPLLDAGDAAAAAATARSAAAAFLEADETEEDASSFEIIIVAADAEVARSLAGTSAEAQRGVRLVVRDAAAARTAGQRQRRSEEDEGEEEAEENGSGSLSSRRHAQPPLLRRSALPPLLPSRSPLLGGGGAGDAALRNAGARAARSDDLLVFLKPGVILRRGYWRSVLSAAEANPKAQFFFTGRRASPSLPETEKPGDEGEWAGRLPWHNPFAFNRAFAVRRSAWVSAGGFSPAAAPGVDVEALLLSALDAPPRLERVDARGELEKEEGAGASGKGSIASSGEPHGYLFAVQASKRRLAGVEGERDEDYSDNNDGNSNRVDEENKAKGSRSASSPLFATSLALVTAHHPLPPQHLIRAHTFLEDGVSDGGGDRDGAARDVLRAASLLSAEGCPLSAGGDLLSGLVHSFAERWSDAGRSFQSSAACASDSLSRVPALAWQASYLNDAVRRRVLEKCVRRSAAALEPGMPGRPRREAAKADAAECVALLVGA